jgi:quercetin dioxygenase-like cupin family protein
LTISAQVTNMEGKTLPDISVKATGPVDREGVTDSAGMVTLNNVLPGAYRLRFEHDTFVTLERDVMVVAGKPVRLSVSLNAAPPPPPPPPKPEPAPAPVLALPPTEGYGPSVVSVQAWIESNFIGRGPAKSRNAGCTGATASTMVQTNESIAEHSHDSTDETIYVVAGEGIFRVSGRESPLAASSFVSIPRGTPHSIIRKGSRPLMFVSTMAGAPCSTDKK